jgi:hypothetical protein
MRPDGQRRMTGHPSNRALYFFSTSPSCVPPLVTIKGRGEQLLQGLDLLQNELHSKGHGSDTVSRLVCNPDYKHP